MAADFDRFKREISFFITALHQSIENYYTKPQTRSKAKLQFESDLYILRKLRSSFNSLIASNKNISVEDFEEFRVYFVKRLRDMYSNFESLGIENGILFSMPKGNSSIFKRSSIFSASESFKYETNLIKYNKMSVCDAIKIFIKYLSEIDSSNFPLQASLFPQELEHIVPPQQIAPVQFIIKDGKIIVSNTETVAEADDRDNISNAFAYISQAGEDIVNNLNNSNCDPRLIGIVRDLHSEIISQGNIIKIGLMNMACSAFGIEFREELPAALSGMLTSYNSIISMYVSQFPDWKRFSNNASSASLDRSDIAELSECADRIIDSLQKTPEISDPEVPKTISFVRKLLTLPGTTSEKAAFAMIRTVENLVSAVVQHGLNFFRKTADHVVEDGSKLTSKVIVALFSLALVGAAGVGPAAMRSGIPWLTQVADILQKHVQKSTD